jgi:hypothetical protein
MATGSVDIAAHEHVVSGYQARGIALLPGGFFEDSKLAQEASE